MYPHWNRGQSKSVSATSSSDSTSSNNDTRRGRGLRCYKCNDYYGHIAKNCDRVPDNDNGDKRETKSDRAFFTALSVQGSPEVNDWYLDSGCSVHSAKDEHCFVSELEPAKVGFSTADQQGSMNSDSVGDIQLPVKVDGAVMSVKVRNIYHVAQLRVNLLSVSQIVDNGNRVVFYSKGALVTDANGEVLASVILKNNLFRLDLDSSNPIYLAAPNTGILWHSRMGHVGLSSMEKLRTLVHGIDSDLKVASDFVCKSCALEKHAVFTSRDIIFSETENGSSWLKKAGDTSRNAIFFPDSSETDDISAENVSSDATGDFSPVDSESADSSIVTRYEEADDASSAVESDSDYISPGTVYVENENLRRGTRDKRPPIHLQDYDLNFVLTVFTVLSDDPVTVDDALSRPEKEEWRKALDREYKAQLNNGTWELVDLPPGRKPLKCKWLFKTELEAV
ncbi:hypothetical protein JTB14_003302 [Gonioctena quinquepunctata]|nr:hypothetical protein JTB14_003302 [Gonioctena quinquepunctata]